MLQVNVDVSGDGLGAKLRVEGYDPAAWKTRWGGPAESAPRLRAYLEAQGVWPECIRDDILRWMGETLGREEADPKDLEAVQGVDVAQGEGPVHGEPRGLVFHRAYLTNLEALVELRRRADAWGAAGIKETIAPEYWIVPGETVFSFQSEAPGRPGRDVFGAPIPCQPCRDRLPPHGKSLVLRDKALAAVCEGVLVVEDGQLKILGADSLPTCQVAAADDGMSANLVLGGNDLNDWTVTLDMVQAALREQGVLCMAAEAEIQGALNRFNHDHQPVTLLVARGRPSLPGRAGRLRMLVDPEPDAPLPAADGTIDFKHFTFFRTVSAGERLAEVIPPEPGEDGIDVFGRALPAAPAGPFASEPGKNTVLTGETPQYVVAGKSGRLAMRVGVPEVVEVLDVSGDVSLKTGNIAFPGAVKVTGDVHGKMAIEAAGDVEVAGSVEDSFIRSDGAIVIKGGVNGSGRDGNPGNGIIKSRLSSVTIGYLHNQRIESHSHIVVYNEIINSQLLARKTITMKFGKYSVLGGYLLAGEGMDLFNVGSEAGSKTILEVGKDFEVEAELKGKNEILQAHSRDLAFLLDMDDRLDRILRLRRGREEEALLRQRTRGAIEIVESWLASLRKDLGELSQRLYLPGTCEILIRGTAHPGTVLKYRDHVLPLHGTPSNRKWIFRERGPGPTLEGSAG